MDAFQDARAEVHTAARRMWEAGLVTGSSGNVSRRVDAAHVAITPTSVPYHELTADEIVIVELESGGAVASIREPSYELPMHLAIYRSRPDVGAIVHTHAPFVTTLSVLRRSLPPLLDEMVVSLGGQIEVADYAFTGTDAVGINVLRALGDRAGVLLANHGNVCIGRDLAHALHAAIAMEAGARVYVQALQLGVPVALPEDSVAAGRRLHDARK
ncbi:MAG TPA: class II aldolase/adducin family protein [Thermoanaerobaculia bacterium]|nr:class II aldolase/adducin family protein [Thermoanaerobaculia bacterium]